MEIHIGEHKLKNIWVKVTGTLQQNWAFVDANQTPIIIYFYDNNKMIFDQLEFESKDVAISGLIWNGFSNALEHKDRNRIVYGEMTEIIISKNKRSFHKPYSSGDYWEQPPDGFIEELETVSDNNSYSVEDSTSEENKYPKLKDVEIDPEKERGKKLLTQKLKFPFDESITYTDTSPFLPLDAASEFERTREKIRQAEDKALKKIKRPSRLRKLRTFDDQ